MELCILLYSNTSQTRSSKLAVPVAVLYLQTRGTFYKHPNSRFLLFSNTQKFGGRGWAKKKSKDVLLHTAKMIDLRVKSQARGQNNGSRALKWDIVQLCKWNGFRDMIKNKICNVLEFSHFLQFSIAIFTFIYKNTKFEKLEFL